MRAFRFIGDLFYLLSRSPGKTFHQVPVHLAQLRVVLDDSGIRALAQDNLRSFGVCFPMRFIVQLLQLFHRMVQARGDRLVIWRRTAVQPFSQALQFIAAPVFVLLGIDLVQQRLHQLRQSILASSRRQHVDQGGAAAAVHRPFTGELQQSLLLQQIQVMPDVGAGHGQRLAQGGHRGAAPPFQIVDDLLPRILHDLYYSTAPELSKYFSSLICSIDHKPGGLYNRPVDVSLNWDAIYEIVLALKTQYPQIDLEEVSLGQVYEWTLALPGFDDDPELANDEILMAIYQEWFEEINPI